MSNVSFALVENVTNFQMFGNFLEHFTTFGFFLGTFAIFLHLLGLFHNCWQLLPSFGIQEFRNLGIFHRFWQILAFFLPCFGNFEQLLPCLGSLSQFLANLAIVSKFKHLWADFGIFMSTLYALTNFRLLL